MYVCVKGGTKKIRETLEFAAYWSANQLMHRNLTRHLIVNIVYGKMEQEVAGDCDWEDDSVNPREFTIRIASHQKLIEALEVLMHEMVHVRQWATGQMKERAPKGHVMTFWNGQDMSNVPYEVQPWEIEAYSLMGPLLSRYLAFIDRNNSICN